ncbi:MAG: hypothetical protein AAF800_00545 [Planctomycetota bacterium]
MPLMIPRRRQLMAAALLAAGTALPPGCATPQIGDAPVAVEVAELPPGVGDAYRRLTRVGVGLADRAEAAERLLEIEDFSADRALAAALTADQPADAWRAVLQAVAVDPAEPPRGLWRPVLALLYSAPDDLVPDAAAALGRYDEPELTRRLTDSARSADLPPRERGRAVAALGHQRRRPVAETLIGLTDLTQPGAVQAAAYAALATMTGIDRLGEDRRAWAAWWDDARRLDPLSWNRQLVANFARSESRQRSDADQLVEKLEAAERALYQASSPEDQAGVLAYMLDSPLVATRLLALDLVRTRLLSGVAFDEPLRAALRQRMVDPESAEVRREAAAVLRDLADEPAADVAADRLLADGEHVNAVKSAYLQVLERMPRKRATDPAYDLLEEPALRADAAAVLASISRANMLTPRRADAVLLRVRGYLSRGQRPSPAVVRLLGRIGEADDWRRVRGWIDDPDDVIRQAAAQAWADSPTRSLAVLAERAGDPIIQPIVLRAAAVRGQDPETLRQLLSHPPRDAPVVPGWERALVAMAAQVPASSALEAVDRLRAERNDGPLIERFLTAALDRAPGSEPAVGEARSELRLERAENRLSMDEPDLAILDFEALLRQPPDTLNDRQRDRLYRGLIPAYLQANRAEPALAAARAFFADPADPAALDPAAADDPLLQQFTRAGHRAADLGRADDARQLLEGLRLLLGPTNPRIPPELAQQMRLLEEKLPPASAASPG